MIFEYLKLNANLKDEEFNVVYPERIRNLSQRHWTPVLVSKLAAQYLVDKPGTKVLDIGSGVGKFCLVGSACTSGHFTGVEQRENLHALSIKVSRSYRIKNVTFIHANIININFKEYDAFYFFNSFYENIEKHAIIDETVPLSFDLYTQYSNYVHHQLEIMPIGTKLVTYWGSSKEVPKGYILHEVLIKGLLKMWEKVF